ncbi:MAG: hypothetical protein WC683_17480 [bacterium]
MEKTMYRPINSRDPRKPLIVSELKRLNRAFKVTSVHQVAENEYIGTVFVYLDNNLPCRARRTMSKEATVRLSHDDLAAGLQDQAKEPCNCDACRHGDGH